MAEKRKYFLNSLSSALCRTEFNTSPYCENDAINGNDTLIALPVGTFKSYLQTKHKLVKSLRPKSWGPVTVIEVIIINWNGKTYDN
jgi:hypothetical protein